MSFGQPFRQVQPKPKKDKCEIVVEKTAKGIRKKIIGNCSHEQLKALASAEESEN